MQTRWMLVVLACLVVVSASNAPAAACSTVVPVPWFAETVSIDQHLLPAGVEYRTAKTWLSNQGATAILIVNHSATPLYLLAPFDADAEDRAALPGVALPEGTAPALKLVDGRLYTWNTAVKQWVVPDYADVTLSFWQNRMQLANGPFIDLDPRNPNDEMRPTGVAVPASQDITLDAVYGTRWFKLPVVLRYALNPAYREPPKARDHPLAGCGDSVPTSTIVPTSQNVASQRSNESFLVAALFGLALASVWVAVWWRKFR